MAVRFLVGENRSGQLMIYEGSDMGSSTPLYTIENDPTYGGYILRSYPSNTIGYRLVRDKSRPENLLAYPGSVVSAGNTIEYYIQLDYSPYGIVRKGDSIYNDEVFHVYESKYSTGPRYIVEDIDQYSQGHSFSSGPGRFFSSNTGKAVGDLVSDPKKTFKENMKHPIRRFVDSYKGLFEDLRSKGKNEAEAEKNASDNESMDMNVNNVSLKDTAVPNTEAKAPHTANADLKGTASAKEGFDAFFQNGASAAVNSTGTQPRPSAPAQDPVFYYLPVGSIVLLKGGTKRICVTGFKTSDASNPSKVYDYIGVLYPEGSLSSQQNLLFDHSQIERVFFEGYRDPEYYQFMQNLHNVLHGKPLK